VGLIIGFANFNLIGGLVLGGSNLARAKGHFWNKCSTEHDR